MFSTARSLWESLSHIGIRTDMVPEESMRVRLLNQIWFGATLLILFYLVGDLFEKDIPGILLEAVAMVISVGILWLNYRTHYIAARWSLMIFYLLIVSAATYLYGGELKGELSMLVMALISLVLFVTLRAKTFFIFLVLVAFLGVQYLLSEYGPPEGATLSPYSNQFLFIFALISFLLIGHAFVNENKRYQRELKQFVGEVNAKNRTLEQQQVVLDLRNQALGQANMELERFAHIASHDLKTPLRNIITFLELIERKLPDQDPTLQQYIGIASRSGQHLYSLIQDIGAYARLGNMQAQEDFCDLNMVFDKAKENLQYLLEDRSAILQKLPLPKVRIYEAHAILLFQNLIENGLKYNTSTIPSVEVMVQERGIYWELCFRDNGIGIDPTHEQEIFEMFKRLHNQEDYPGSGLGLAICKRIVEQYQGSIRMVSSPSGGSSFIIQWPKHLLVHPLIQVQVDVNPVE